MSGGQHHKSIPTLVLEMCGINSTVECMLTILSDMLETLHNEFASQGQTANQHVCEDVPQHLQGDGW
jgi:hypothetical protein